MPLPAPRPVRLFACVLSAHDGQNVLHVVAADIEAAVTHVTEQTNDADASGTRPRILQVQEIQTGGILLTPGAVNVLTAAARG